MSKDDHIEKFCRETIAEMGLPDDADSRWRWVGPIYATGYWQQDEIIDLFPTRDTKDQRHLERQIRWCCKKTEHGEGPGWLLLKLGQEGYQLNSWMAAGKHRDGVEHGC